MVFHGVPWFSGCRPVSHGFPVFPLTEDSNIDLEGLEEAMAQSVAALARAKEGSPQRERPGSADSPQLS